MILDSITKADPADSASAQRRQAFVDLARDSFFSHGYAGTAMSTIAAKAGGSKTTLWSYFPSKQDLFVAVVDDLVERFGTMLRVPLPPETLVEDAMRQFGNAMMSIVLTPPIIALHRLVIGEAGRFPELGRLFYEHGPSRGKAKLAEYLAAAMADGRVRPGDPFRAASEFAFLCRSGCYEPHLLGMIDGDVQMQVARDVDAAVETWLARWRGSNA
jgi:TetR/AcrR family transcriptional regulator, mexJK operon transcriptional repressor